MKAMITDIKRFAVHDGPGIRTTVFFKGCPLRCLWCHNPETQSAAPQIAFFSHKCTLCGACIEVCSAHKMTDGEHLFLHNQCTQCDKCISVCQNDAIVHYGKEMTVDDLFSVVCKDKNFYDTSGGGITLSGGECLIYPAFCAELLQKCKENGVHTAVDTCGYVAKEAFDAVIPYTDLFLYDIKAMDDTLHQQCTGVSNAKILENLQYLDACGCNIEIRIPSVPAYTEREVETIKEFAASFSHIHKVTVLQYHDLARSRYTALGMEYKLQ